MTREDVVVTLSMSLLVFGLCYAASLLVPYAAARNPSLLASHPAPALERR